MGLDDLFIRWGVVSYSARRTESGRWNARMVLEEGSERRTVYASGSSPDDASSTIIQALEAEWEENDYARWVRDNDPPTCASGIPWRDEWGCAPLVCPEPYGVCVTYGHGEGERHWRDGTVMSHWAYGVDDRCLVGSTVRP